MQSEQGIGEIHSDEWKDTSSLTPYYITTSYHSSGYQILACQYTKRNPTREPSIVGLNQGRRRVAKRTIEF